MLAKCGKSVELFEVVNESTGFADGEYISLRGLAHLRNGRCSGTNQSSRTYDSSSTSEIPPGIDSAEYHIGQVECSTLQLPSQFSPRLLHKSVSPGSDDAFHSAFFSASELKCTYDRHLQP